ncbi:MAG: thioredoxin family protein [Bacteroidetes bacterium]|nr:thioredoxin family protein [Bacteroidota bacterium]
MKFLLTVLFAFIIIITSAQSPVQWKVTAEKKDSNTYLIRVNATINNGWYLYAITDTTNGLEGPAISIRNAHVKMKGTLQPSTTPMIISDEIFASSKESVFQEEASFIQEINVGSNVSSLQLTLNAYTANGKEFTPIAYDQQIILDSSYQNNLAAEIKLPSINIHQPLSDCGAEQRGSLGMILIFFLGMGGGLLALLTPCVFPMIPLTVSFFAKRSVNRKQAIHNALLYGVFIFLIYITISIPFHLFRLSPEVLNAIATNVWLNLAFFIIFIGFSLSFFGLFNITIPGSIASKADAKSNITSISGIFFMALTLAIVSFSCTGPILGSLLVGSLGGGAWPLTCGLAGFGLALALPFALFAIFPQRLARLPKSGSWLDTVKKALAFIELALAFKFLSNADLVAHWGILKREVFLIIWIVIFGGLALYLFRIFGKDKTKLPAARIIAGCSTLLFVAYMFAGLINTSSLLLLSGFPPPVSYSIYNNKNSQQNDAQYLVVNDYNKALQLSKTLQRPVLIDFTGWACVNCRKMEENVLSEPGIKEMINEHCIVLSLCVDDKAPLPSGQTFHYTNTEGNTVAIETTGDKWATFEAENFKQVSQPLYALLTPEEKLINHPVGYTPDEKEYKEWLQCGLDVYENASSR